MPGCVDCGRPTGNFCEGLGGDLCSAYEELLQPEERKGQLTPLCTVCDRAKGSCKFCRQSGSVCTPTPKARPSVHASPSLTPGDGCTSCEECQGQLNMEFLELTDQEQNANFNYQAQEGGPRHAEDIAEAPIINIMKNMEVQLTCGRCRPDATPRFVNWASFNENQIGLMQTILGQWAMANALIIKWSSHILNLEPYLLAARFLKALTSIFEMPEDRCEAHWFSKVITCCVICQLGQQHAREVGGGEDDLFYKALEEYRTRMEEACGVKVQLVAHLDQDKDTTRATCVHQTSRVKVLHNDKTVPFGGAMQFKHYTCTPTTMTASRIISGAPWDLVHMELRRRAEAFEGHVPGDCLGHEIRILDPKAASAYWVWAVLDLGLSPLHGQQGPCCGCGSPTLTKCKCLLAYFCVDCANHDYFTVPLVTDSVKIRTGPRRSCRRCINEAQKALGLR